MDTLTLTLVLGAVLVLLTVLIGIFIRRRRSLKPISSIRLPDNVPRHRAAATSPKPSRTESSTHSAVVKPSTAKAEIVTSVQRLEAQLLVRFSGNQDQLRRNREYERQKNPHLDEAALLEKMLYDLRRGR